MKPNKLLLNLKKSDIFVWKIIQQLENNERLFRIKRTMKDPKGNLRFTICGHSGLPFRQIVNMELKSSTIYCQFN